MSSESSHTLASLVVHFLRTIVIWEFVFFFPDWFSHPISSSTSFSIHVSFSTVGERASSQERHPGHFPAVKGLLPWDLDSAQHQSCHTLSCLSHSLTHPIQHFGNHYWPISLGREWYHSRGVGGRTETKPDSSCVCGKQLVISWTWAGEGWQGGSEGRILVM